MLFRNESSLRLFASIFLIERQLWHFGCQPLSTLNMERVVSPVSARKWLLGPLHKKLRRAQKLEKCLATDPQARWFPIVGQLLMNVDFAECDNNRVEMLRQAANYQLKHNRPINSKSRPSKFSNGKFCHCVISDWKIHRTVFRQKVWALHWQRAQKNTYRLFTFTTYTHSPLSRLFVRRRPQIFAR